MREPLRTGDSGSLLAQCPTMPVISTRRLGARQATSAALPAWSHSTTGSPIPRPSAVTELAGIPRSMNYYVALFHEKQFWRVIRTDQIDNAEKLYATFAEQTEQLAQVYLDTLRLDAGKRYTEKLVAMNENRLRGLEQEMAQQQAQAVAVSQSIADNRQQAVALSGDLKATNSQLEALQNQIRALQALQLDPNLNLPSVGTATSNPAQAPEPVQEPSQP